MDKTKLKNLQKTLKYRFKDRQLLQQALTHPSYVQGTAHSNEHNQRLEFLGDSILGMVVADELYTHYPDKREGFLTKARSSVCHGKSLTNLGNELELQDYILLGRGEQRAKSKARSQVIGDCVEAIIGAVYLDGGYKSARKLILRWVLPLLERLEKEMVAINYKGTLQEWSQSNLGDNYFIYELIGSSGPDHAKEFEISINIHGKEIARAGGYSKKEAESKAAKKVLEIVKAAGNKLPDFFGKDSSQETKESTDPTVAT